MSEQVDEIVVKAPSKQKSGLSGFDLLDYMASLRETNFDLNVNAEIQFDGNALIRDIIAALTSDADRREAALEEGDLQEDNGSVINGHWVQTREGRTEAWIDTDGDGVWDLITWPGAGEGWVGFDAGGDGDMDGAMTLAQWTEIAF